MNIGSLTAERSGDVSNAKVSQASANGVSATGSVVNNAGGGDPAFQVVLDSSVQLLLDELSAMIQQRQELLSTLPEQIQKAVRNLVQTNTVGQETIANGLVDIIKAEKTVALQIQQLAEEIVYHLDRSQLQEMADTLPELIKKNVQNFLARGNSLPESPNANSGFSQQETAEQAVRTTTTGSEQGGLIKQDKIMSGKAAQPAAGEAGALPARQQLQHMVDTLPESARKTLQNLLMKDSSSPLKNDITAASLQDKTAAELNVLTDKDGPNNLARQERTIEDKPQQFAGTAGLSRDWQQIQFVISKLPEHMKKSLQALLAQDDSDAEQQKLSENTPGRMTEAGRNLNSKQAETVLGQIRQLLEKLASPHGRQLLQDIPDPEATADKSYTPLKQNEAPTGKPEQPRSIMDILPESSKTELQAFLIKERIHPDKFKAIAETLQELASTYQKPAGAEAEMQRTGATLALSIPLYLGEGNIPYPAYIHLYKQDKEQSGYGETSGQDIWLRICLSTEHIGLVDIIFHLYNQSIVNVGVTFSGDEPARSFENFIPLVQQEFEGSGVTLAEIRVKTTGVDHEKRRG